MLQLREFVSNSASTLRDVTSGCVGVIKQGVHNGAYVLNSHYSPTGFLNIGKAAIASMRLHCALTGSGFFNHAINHFEHQKNLLYTTMFFQDLGSFIVKDASGRYSLRWPSGDRLDSWAKVLNAVGNFLEMVRCAMVYQLMGKPVLLTTVSDRLGNVPVRVPFFGSHRLERVPVLQTLVNKPKDLFIFSSSLLNLVRCAERVAFPTNEKGRFWGQFSWEDRFKLTSSIGKMVLISMGNWYGNRTWFRVADFITQWASEIKFVITVENKWEQIQQDATARIA